MNLQRLGVPPAAVGLAAFVLVVGGIDPAGSYPRAPQGPGLTIDESFNVQQGVRLVEGGRAWLLGAVTIREVFGDRDDQGEHAPLGYHLADHPPLGRWWIGMAHHLTGWLVPPHDHPSPFATACARTAPASAFALTVFLVGWMTARWYGREAGTAAAVAVLLMPRLFGHAHLAALESFIGLTYAAAVLCVADVWTRRPEDAAPSVLATTAALTGVVFGLALLSKIQAVLLPVPIAVWALWHWRKRAVVPLAAWGAVGFVVFFLGWPWLWLDPLDHLREYFGRTAERIELHVWYLGQRFGDRAVPWHYPFVMFLVTVPVGLHVLGFLGVFASGRLWRKESNTGGLNKGDRHPHPAEVRRTSQDSREPVPLVQGAAWKGPREQLLLGCVLFPLLVFSLPGTAVYDGARLFLVVFPLWGVFVGRGSLAALDWLRRKRPGRTAPLLLGVFLAAQGYGLIATAPCWLSYYNLTVGGLRGAERLGFEPTYWGDSLTRELLRTTVAEVPPGATLHVAPVLHQFQLPEMLVQSPVLRGHQLRLEAWDGTGEFEYLLVFRRQADLPERPHAQPAGVRPLAEVRRQGVLLAALYAVER